MERVDDRINDAFDRRHFNAWCGLWRDEHGRHYQRTLWWHPAFWVDLLRPSSMFRGMRLSALRTFIKNRRTFIYDDSEPPDTRPAEAVIDPGED
jgi:hypothetical protein